LSSATCSDLARTSVLLANKGHGPYLAIFPGSGWRPHAFLGSLPGGAPGMPSHIYHTLRPAPGQCPAGSSPLPSWPLLRVAQPYSKAHLCALPLPRHLHQHPGRQSSSTSLLALSYCTANLVRPCSQRQQATLLSGTLTRRSEGVSYSTAISVRRRDRIPPATSCRPTSKHLTLLPCRLSGTRCINYWSHHSFISLTE
jgi:hypothetical protein